MTRRRKKGFTLLELLTVLAILVLLAGLLFPVLSQARDAARRAHCLSNLRQLALAHRIYVQDDEETLPPAYQYSGYGWRYWPEYLRPYYRDGRILEQGFTTPQEREKSGWLADYAMCAWGPDGLGTAGNPYYCWPGAPSAAPINPQPMRLAEVLPPGEVLQFVDGLTSRSGLRVLSRHARGVLNGAFVDGHAGRITETEYNQVERDERGSFYTLGAADR